MDTSYNGTKINIPAKQCYCIGADKCKDINCRLVQDYIQSNKIKPENKLSLDELCRIHGGIFSIPLAN